MIRHDDTPLSLKAPAGCDARVTLAPKGLRLSERSLKIQSHNLERLAIVYVRQSSVRQVRENIESTQLQYSLVDRARACGWPEQRIEVIDDPLLGLVSQATQPGTVLSFTTTDYDAAGRAWQTTDAFNRQTQTLYDRFGQSIETRTQSKDALGADVWLVSRTVYDALGRVTFTSDQFVLPGTTLLGEGYSAYQYWSRKPGKGSGRK